MKIELHLTGSSLPISDLSGKTVVVIDLLRFTTTVCAALKAGAKAVIPVDSPGSAGDVWTKIGPENAILAGEQKGVKIENFLLGNSPLEFTPETVADKFVIMTTTNGSPLFEKVALAPLVLSCSLVNISVVAKRIEAEGRDLLIACAGHEGSFSIEDSVCGGMLIALLRKQIGTDLKLNDAGLMAETLYLKNCDNLYELIKAGDHGDYLASIGFSDDVTAACSIDSIPLLPLLKDGRLQLEF